jgi:hypothetical protein
MSKPPHKPEEDDISSGSDTESESAEDEDTVSLLVAYFSKNLSYNFCNQLSTSLGLDGKSESSFIHDQFIYKESYSGNRRKR